MDHSPYSEKEADRVLEARVRDYGKDSGRLADPEVGRFYAALQDDEDLFDLFQASVLAEYARPELLAIDEGRIRAGILSERYEWKVTVQVKDMNRLRCSICGDIFPDGSMTCSCPPVNRRSGVSPTTTPN